MQRLEIMSACFVALTSYSILWKHLFDSSTSMHMCRYGFLLVNILFMFQFIFHEYVTWASYLFVIECSMFFLNFFAATKNLITLKMLVYLSAMSLIYGNFFPGIVLLLEQMQPLPNEGF